MREKKEYIVITFASTTRAMHFEDEAMKAGIPGRMIPTPQSISAGCGIVFRMEISDFEKYESIISKEEYESVAKVLI